MMSELHFTKSVIFCRLVTVCVWFVDYKKNEGCEKSVSISWK